MAYLLYTACGVEIIHDEEIEEHKRLLNPKTVLARFSISEIESQLPINELMKIYPQPVKNDDET